jgi:hypothetical protein
LNDLTIQSNKFTEIIAKFPDGLKSLDLQGTSFNNVIDKLPDTLKLLSLPFNYNKPLQEILPDSLEFLRVPQLGLQYLDKKPNAMEVIDIDAKQAFDNVEKLQNTNCINNASNNASNKKIMLNIVSSRHLSSIYTNTEPYTNDKDKRWDFINYPEVME